METASGDTFDVIGKRQLLVDGDAEAGSTAAAHDSRGLLATAQLSC